MLPRRNVFAREEIDMPNNNPTGKNQYSSDQRGGGGKSAGGSEKSSGSRAASSSRSSGGDHRGNPSRGTSSPHKR